MNPTLLPAPILPEQPSALRPWQWAVVPALALLAYAPVLWVGFLLDDYLSLYTARHGGFTWEALWPSRTWFFYRPVGTMITWELGWSLWGATAWPYHLLGLLLHAATALLLARWVAVATGQAATGWLAGALFAVFPLHLEAVGWLAAQWDAWAAFFVLASLYLFTTWWQRGGLARYGGALACYGLALFSKESVIAWLPVFALAAWLARSPDRLGWWRLGGALGPFAGLLAVYLGIRLAAWGTIGGYPGTDMDYGAWGWDHSLAYAHLLLAPINPAVWGPALAQVVGATVSIGLLVALVGWGWGQRRLLLVAGVWVALGVLPALALLPRAEDLQQNRFLYLSAAGYCAIVAALHAPLLRALRRPRLAGALVGGGLLLSALICWGQIAPWQVATAQVATVADELRTVIPPGLHPGGVVWYVQDPPLHYKGAYLLDNALGHLRHLTDHEYTPVVKVANIATAPLATAPGDAFALRFAYDGTDTRYHIDAAAGITAAGDPPSGAQLWDFRACAPAVIGAWQAGGGQATCEAGEGLVLQPTGDDPALILPAGTSVGMGHMGQARLLRLRAQVRPLTGLPPDRVSEWYWADAQGGWDAARSRQLPLKAGLDAHVYWTFAPLATMDAADGLPTLRFDPVNANVPVVIGWIALDAVP